MIEDLTPDEIQAQAEGIVQEIKQTPIAIAKEQALVLEQLFDKVEEAEILLNNYKQLKSQLAEYCEANNIYEIETGKHRYVVVRGTPESYEQKIGFATQLFELDYPKLYKKYESIITEKKSGRKPYLREVKK